MNKHVQRVTINEQMTALASKFGYDWNDPEDRARISAAADADETQDDEFEGWD